MCPDFDPPSLAPLLLAPLLLGLFLGVGCEASNPVPTPRSDGGEDLCEEGRHMCGSVCAPDQAQDPLIGCRLGCGDPCPSPSDGRAVCERDGRCGFECVAPSVPEAGGCSCASRTCAGEGFECGEFDNGCGGSLRCGSCANEGFCLEGTCVCAPDEGEDNQEEEQAHELPGMADHPDSAAQFTDFGLGTDTDVDWYSIAVLDNFDTPLGGNPNITVTLSMVPAGAQYQLGAWYVCPSNSSECKEGTMDREAGRGCIADTDETQLSTVRLDAECGGSDENGTLFIRVSAITPANADECGNYQLDVDIR